MIKIKEILSRIHSFILNISLSNVELFSSKKLWMESFKTEVLLSTLFSLDTYSEQTGSKIQSANKKNISEFNLNLSKVILFVFYQ